MHLIYDLPGDVQGVIFKKVFEMEVLNQLKYYQKIFIKLSEIEVGYPPRKLFVPENNKKVFDHTRCLKFLRD